MQFFYDKDAGQSVITIDGEAFNYIFKVRRQKSDEVLNLRNLCDKNIYKYEVISIDRRKAKLTLLSTEELIVESKKSLHIAWCKIDPKSIEKNIASLNEIGVEKITFIECEYSQKNYKINKEKIEKLLINSSSQCGRSSIIDIDYCDSLDNFLEKYPDSFIFNFSKNNISQNKEKIETIIIGCEGGFSLDEIKRFEEDKIVGIDSSLILRSETAVISVASHILQ